MKFDKSKVYTALNADELKIGSKVIVADNIKDLKKNVKASDSIYIDTLERVNDEICSARFFDGEESWNLAYLVEEPEGLKWTDLKVGDIITNGKITAMVTAIVSSAFTSSHIYAGSKWLCDDELKDWEKVEND